MAAIGANSNPEDEMPPPPHGSLRGHESALSPEMRRDPSGSGHQPRRQRKGTRVKPTFGVSIETTGPDCKVDRIVAVAVFNPSDVLSVVGSNEHRLLDHLYRFLHSVPAGVLATGDGGRFEAPFIVSRSRRAGMDRTWFRQVVDVAGTERLARDDRSTGAVYQLAVESASPDVYLSPTSDLLPALTDGASRPGEAAHAAARPGS